MNLHFEENSSRKKIISLLKRSGGMSIEELSEKIAITPMGVRQHLMSLEKRGFVRYMPKKHGIGRPVFIYMLTEKAEGLFPKSYDTLSLGILKNIRDSLGADKANEVLKSRKDSLVKALGSGVSSLPIEEKLKELQRVLDAEGHMIELGRQNGNWTFRNYNCPVRAVSTEFQSLCMYDHELLKELFGNGVLMEQNISKGDPCCFYLIPNR